MSSENYIENKLRQFPEGVKLIIDVVFTGEYRIGFEYDGRRYVPGTATYFPFGEALENCIDVFRGMFPSQYSRSQLSRQSLWRGMTEYEIPGLIALIAHETGREKVNVRVRITNIEEAISAIRRHLIYLARMMGFTDFIEGRDIIELREDGGIGFERGKQTLIFLRQAVGSDGDGRILARLPEAIYRINPDLTIQACGQFGGEFLLSIGSEIKGGE